MLSSFGIVTIPNPEMGIYNCWFEITEDVLFGTKEEESGKHEATLKEIQGRPIHWACKPYVSIKQFYFLFVCFKKG